MNYFYQEKSLTQTLKYLYRENGDGEFTLDLLNVSKSQKHCTSWFRFLIV